MTSAVLPVVEALAGRDLDRLWPVWDDVLADSDRPSPFQSAAWLRTWVSEDDSGSTPLVVAATEPGTGTVVGIAPLAVEARTSGLAHRTITFLGQGPAAPDRLDFIVRRGHASVAPLLWDAAVASARADLVDLDGARRDSLARSVVLRRSADRSLVETTPAPRLALPGSWDEYQATLGKNLRQNLRRYARKMDREMPEGVVERIVADRSEVVPTMDALGRMHQAIRTSRGDRGAFATEQDRRFHRRTALRLFDEGRLRLHRLDVGDRVVAAIYCFRHHDTVAFYSTGYDERLSRYGPGRRIMAAAIGSAIEEGATWFDFLRGDEPYKEAWGPVDEPIERVRRPLSPLGRLLWTGRELRRALRQAS